MARASALRRAEEKHRTDRADPPAAPDEVIVFQPLSDLRAKPVTWLVPGRIPRGKLILVAGDGGMGKSTLVRHLVARVTTGRPAFGMDYTPGPPASVVLFAGEDGCEDVVLPSLIAEGADLNRVSRIPYVETLRRGKKDRVLFGLEHLALLKAELKARPDVALGVVDPVASFVGRCRIDDHKQGELRRVLDPLSELAEETGATIIVIAHVNKASEMRAVHRIAGSTGYVNAVRLAYVVGPDPDDDARRLLMPVKFNLLGIERAALAFRLAKVTADEAAGHRRHTAFRDLSDADFVAVTDQMARLEFDAPVQADPDRVMGGRQGDGDGRREKRERCIEWLVRFLSDLAYPSDEVFAAGEAAGFSRTLLYGARKAFNSRTPDLQQIWATNQGNFGGAYWWGVGSPAGWRRRPNPDEDGIAADLRREAVAHRTGSTGNTISTGSMGSTTTMEETPCFSHGSHASRACHASRGSCGSQKPA